MREAGTYALAAAAMGLIWVAIGFVGRWIWERIGR